MQVMVMSLYRWRWGGMTSPKCEMCSTLSLPLYAFMVLNDKGVCVCVWCVCGGGAISLAPLCILDYISEETNLTILGHTYIYLTMIVMSAVIYMYLGH